MGSRGSDLGALASNKFRTLTETLVQSALTER